MVSRTACSIGPYASAWVYWLSGGSSDIPDTPHPATAIPNTTTDNTATACRQRRNPTRRTVPRALVPVWSWLI